MPAPRSKPFRMPRRPRADPEGDLQRAVVAALRLAGVDFCHVPNSTGRAGARGQAKLVGLGVERGVSDLLIFTPPRFPRRWIKTCAGDEFMDSHVGACLELKAKDGPIVDPWDDKRATEEQREFLRRRAASGWAVAVCGPGEVWVQLRAWGYRV